MISFVGIVENKHRVRPRILSRLANDSEPEHGTPGFGAVVALIALISTAL